jgi:CelD/BcsL family acetyltransferase involved in cellulose biosynthesis
MVTPGDASPDSHPLLCESSKAVSGGFIDGGQFWHSVYAASDVSSVFLSPQWTDCWLRTYADALSPDVLQFRDMQGQAVAACLVTSSAARLGPVTWRRLHLNTDGEPAGDSVITEHNGILAIKGTQQAASTALAAYVMASDADEFVAAGVSESELERLSAAFPGWAIEVEWRDAPFVDLAAMRRRDLSHLEVISANTRAQLRRTMRRYRAGGELEVALASSEGEAERWFDEMVMLHERRWASRARAGAFVSPPRRAFHRRFITSTVAPGLAHLLRVSVAGATIGILYNLQAKGRVHYYQSGFAYSSDPRLKPGLLTHHLAIEFYKQRGFLEYDFLASRVGESRYKRSLATHGRRLAWVAVARPGWRSVARAQARRFRALFRQWTA